MYNNSKYITVKNKETGKLSAIRSLSFDSRFFEQIATSDDARLPTPPEPPENAPEAPLKSNLDTLLDRYEAKHGQRPVGRWSRDERWLESKLG